MPNDVIVFDRQTEIARLETYRGSRDSVFDSRISAVQRMLRAFPHQLIQTEAGSEWVYDAPHVDEV